MRALDKDKSILSIDGNIHIFLKNVVTIEKKRDYFQSLNTARSLSSYSLVINGNKVLSDTETQIDTIINLILSN